MSNVAYYYTLDDLREIGWTDKSLYLLNNHWELKDNLKGEQIWMVSALIATQYESYPEFLRWYCPPPNGKRRDYRS